MNTNYNKSSTIKIAASLGLITVLGPAAVDMYLASMPKMAQELNTSYPTLQYSLTVFLIALGLGQLIFGPITDTFGRRKPLLSGIVIFIITSLITAAANTIEVLLIARFFQGIAASLTLVTAISSVRDLSSGATATKIFALLMTVEGLAPVLAPAVGGVIDIYYGWRGVMVGVAILGVLALINSLINLPESLPQNKRLALNPSTITKTYWSIASDMNFLMPALALSAAFFFLFMYVAGASFVYQNYYNITPSSFGILFGFTGISILLGAVLSGRLASKYSIQAISKSGAILMLVGTLIAWLSANLGLGLYGITFGMFISLFGLGMIETTVMSLAMSSQTIALGSTAALLGCLQMLISSTATPISGKIAQFGANQWFISLAISSILVFALVFISNSLNKESTQKN